MVFWASLPPCPREYSEADANCKIRNARSTANGVERTEAQDTIAVRSSASRNPISGDSTMASNVFDSPLQTTTDMPALVMPAPSNPPINAWELLDGMPSAHVMTFHMMAPISAAKITCASMTSACTMPVPIVCATCSPNTANAMKLKNAAHATAYCGRNTRVDTIVAIEFAASCKPLRKSNINATAMSPTRMGKASEASTT